MLYSGADDVGVHTNTYINLKKYVYLQSKITFKSYDDTRPVVPHPALVYINMKLASLTQASAAFSVTLRLVIQLSVPPVVCKQAPIWLFTRTAIV